MNLNDVLMRQSFFVNLALKNGSKELSKELKFKIINNRTKLNKYRKEFEEFIQESIEEFKTDEYKELLEQMGLTKNDVLQLFKSHIKTQLPPKETDRIIQFYRLCLLTLIDEKITFEELSKLRNVGINMGLSPTATEEIIRMLQGNKGKALSPESLIQVFKVNMN